MQDILLEQRLASFIARHEAEWLVVCGVAALPADGGREVARLLREVGLFELEAMLLWRAEHDLLRGCGECS